MKKRLLISISVMFTLLIVSNMYFVLTQDSFSNLFLGKLDALAETECGKNEFDDQILVVRSQRCSKHDTNHEWMDCVGRDGKCCNSTQQTARPTCLDSSN